MSAVRIIHPTLRACTLLIPHPGGEGRKAKDYHIRIDGNGYSIVSETTWMRLQQATAAGELHGFIVVNEVKHPPGQTISMSDSPVEQRRMYRQIQAAIAEIAPGISNVTITQEGTNRG